MKKIILIYKSTYYTIVFDKIDYIEYDIEFENLLISVNSSLIQFSNINNDKYSELTNTLLKIQQSTFSDWYEILTLKEMELNFENN